MSSVIREVAVQDSSSEAFRHLCEVRSLQKKGYTDGMAYLDLVKKARGEAAMRRLIDEAFGGRTDEDL